MLKLYELLAKVGTNHKLRAWALKEIKKLMDKERKLLDDTIDMKKLMKGDKPIKLYSGSMNRQSNTWQSFKETAKDLGTTPEIIAKDKFKGQWFTPFKRYADSFSSPKYLESKMRTVDLTPDEIRLAKRYVDKVNKTHTLASMRKKLKIDKGPKQNITTNENTVIIPRYKLKELEKSGRMKTDYMILEKLKKKIGLAEGGRIGLDEGGPSQKDIDKGIAAIEKLKSSLMPESYEELIEIYKDKQKDLNIDIMEDAGGLGEMLGEGGRTGMYAGGLAAWLAKQGPKIWKWANKPGNNPIDLYKKYLKSVKTRAQAGDMKSLAPEMGAVTAGGIMANRWVSKKLKEATNLDRLNFAEEQIEDLKKDQFYSERPELLEERINEIREDATRERKWWDKGGFNDGGRVGMMYGGDPGFAFSYGGSWADWKENHASEMPVMDYINQKLPKARNPFSDSSYQDGGEVTLSWEEVFTKHMQGQPLTDEERKILGQVPTDDKAEGGRIGMAKGDTPSEAYLRDLFYDGGWDDRGDIGLHEFMHGPIGANEWFKHNNKAEGGRIGFKKGGKGGIGDLMSEMYRLFEIAPLLATPELMDLIQKVPFDKGGKVKKGGGPNMSRRSFLQLMGGLASLPVVGKYFKLAKTKPVKDISVKLKSWIDDSDEMTEYGPQAVGRWAGNFDISSLTPQGVNILKNLFGKSVKTVKDKTGKITASMDDVATDDAAMYVDDIIKKGKGVIDFKYVDDIVGGTGSVDAKLASYAQTFGKNSKIYKDFLKRSKKMTEKQKIKYELDGSDDPYVDDVLDLVYPGKSEGGIIEDDEFREFLEDRKNRDKDNFQRDFFEDFKKWKKWKEGNIQEAKDGGRMWQPKSAPQLTTTIPPESGPMPHGLTYLTGDDIVQNIGYKHGRN